MAEFSILFGSGFRPKLLRVSLIYLVDSGSPFSAEPLAIQGSIIQGQLPAYCWKRADSKRDSWNPCSRGLLTRSDDSLTSLCIGSPPKKEFKVFLDGGVVNFCYLYHFDSFTNDLVANLRE